MKLVSLPMNFFKYRQLEEAHSYSGAIVSKILKNFVESHKVNTSVIYLIIFKKSTFLTSKISTESFKLKFFHFHSRWHCTLLLSERFIHCYLFHFRFCPTPQYAFSLNDLLSDTISLQDRGFDSMF